ncbi:hypothetical protein F4821DRAFT_252670 [Hypoxylon rubiginosum]|uniref:Uncharacterized protein n=1 Tax=Hypoxylon rubiginosum TaxID=110542 RepID=A0ACC0DLL0_9PEZI|nr:hypothetical protein F4821DRAFT_252670 [Hypoxylon rubiginosum]
MTKSNTPSELPDDPIVVSSNASIITDERPSSPGRTGGTQDFSQAAQMETEPIPPDNPLLDAEDMIYPSSPPRPSVGETDLTSVTLPSRDLSDPDDPDFEVPESDDDEQDVDKTVTTQRRGKKRAVTYSKKAPKKASGKSQAATQKRSKRTTTSNKVIQDSQVLAEKQTYPKQPTTRLPKKSFYSQSEEKPSADAAQKPSDNAKPQSSTKTKADKKQSSGSRGHARPASPIEIVDYDNEGDDYWYSLSSPGNSEIKATAPDLSINSKSTKKRERNPEKAEVKPKKPTTRSSAQKPPEKSKKGTSSSTSTRQGNQHEQSPKSSEPSLPKAKKLVSSGHGASQIPNTAGTLARIEEEQDEGAKQKPECIDTTGVSVSETIVSEQDIQQDELVVAVPPTKSVPPELSESNNREARGGLFPPLAPVAGVSGDGEKRTTAKSQPVDKSHDRPSKPSQSHKQTNVRKDVSEKTSMPSHSSSRQEYSAEVSSDRDGDLKHLKKKGKARVEDGTAEQIYFSSTRNASSSQFKARSSNTRGRKSGSGEVYIDKPEGGRIVNQEQMSVSEAGSYQQHSLSPIQLTRRSMVSESGSPLASPIMPTRNIAVGGRNPHGEQYESPANQVFADTGTSRLQTAISSPTDNKQSRDRVTMQPSVLRDPAYREPGNNRMSRMMMSSSTNGDLVGRGNDFVRQAPQLHPKSIDFARRMVQEQNEMEFGEDSRQGPVEKREYQSTNRFSWSQPTGATKRRNDPNQVPPRDTNLANPGGHSFRGGHGRPNDSLTYEAKWKDAVDAASGGVVDALHQITNNLVEHLRTKEESVFDIVREYKRNGTKITQRIVERQREELREAEKRAEKKFAELAEFYGDLSSKAQAFRAECLAKDRSPAYMEWERHTAKVKAAIREVRESGVLD